MATSLPPLIECIPNVSEGRDPAVLAALAGAIRATPGVRLLHTDTGYGAHRTVFTFAGEPEPVFAAARHLYRVAADRIDMRRHRGEHPRIGAVDVCPLVPIRGISLADLAARTQVQCHLISSELGIPLYRYEASASAPHRRNLANIRRGEYEGLPEKLRDPRWPPDHGPAAFHPTFGAGVIGARPFLIAWNLNLAAGATVAQAQHIARRLRGSGYRGRPGRFPGLKAIGWHIPEYARCQVSCNVVDTERTNLAEVYTAAATLAREAGTAVTGSELIGLVPAAPLLRAGRWFAPDLTDEEQLFAAAITGLGLEDLSPFRWRERVLEQLI